MSAAEVRAAFGDLVWEAVMAQDLVLRSWSETRMSGCYDGDSAHGQNDGDSAHGQNEGGA